MSVRKRTWTTRKGETKEAWIVDYAVNGSRHIETFERKRDADAYEAKVTVNIGQGTHIAPNKTPTVKEAGKKSIEACPAAELEQSTIDAYKQHLKLHIEPYLGSYRLALLSVPIIRQFMDDILAGKLPPERAAKEGKTQSDDEKRSPAMTRRVVVSLGTMLADAQERGLVVTNVVRSLKINRKRKKTSKRDQRRKLKVGVDIRAQARSRRSLRIYRIAGGR